MNQAFRGVAAPQRHKPDDKCPAGAGFWGSVPNLSQIGAADRIVLTKEADGFDAGNIDLLLGHASTLDQAAKISELIGADLDFHMGILEATGNHFLTALGGLIGTSLECTFELSWEGASRIQDDRLHQHRGIFEAIRDGSPELAKIRMTELLADSMNDVRQYLRQRDAASEPAAP